MADLHGIRQLLNSSIDDMIVLSELLEAFEAVADPEKMPPWFRCLRRAFDQAEASREALECVIRRQVLSD